MQKVFQICLESEYPAIRIGGPVDLARPETYCRRGLAVYGDSRRPGVGSRRATRGIELGAA